MSPLNRRDFLKRGSMAVAAAGVVSAVPMALPALAGAATAGPAAAPTDTDDVGAGEEESGGQLDQPLVAHVRDLDTGEIGIFYGDREVIHRDRKLAAQLHRAAT